MYGTFNSVLETIGRTPLIRLGRVADGLPCPVYAKVEFFNPGNSVKDRVAKAMIDKAERDGLIEPGRTTIVEATSGNTGVGLALVAAVKGYRCIFVIPDKMAQEKIDLLKAYGAEVVIVPTNVPPDSPDSYNGVSERLVREIPNAWRPNQFGNLSNPQIHELTTGPEIWEQTQGRVTCFVCGIGTGGTISGVGKYLKDRNPKLRIVAADPEGSVLSGDRPHPWQVEGIGEDYVPKTLNTQVIDDWVRVSDKESFLAARRVARSEGLLVGGSCGTCIAAALRYAERLTPDDLLVVMSPDTGRNYISRCYNDEWMAERGWLEDYHPAQTAADVLKALGDRPLYSLTPEHTVQDAIECCRSNAISQLPIIENNRVLGALQEVTFARLLYEGGDPREIRLREVMAPPMPEVSVRTSVDEIYRRLLTGSTGVIVRRDNREIAGILTRIDLVNFWDQSALLAKK